MYIDGDTHYWPLRFIDKVKHPGKGHVEVVEDKGDMVRYGEVVPGKVATYYRDGKKVHSFKEGRWSISLRAEFMKKDGFDKQVLIPDNRPLIYECDPELGRQLARAYNDTVAEDIQGDDRFIGCALFYLHGGGGPGVEVAASGLCQQLVGFQQLKGEILVALSQQAPVRLTGVGESTGLYWWHVFYHLSHDPELAVYDPQLALLNPLHVKRFRQALAQQDKSDLLDPTLIDRYYRAVGVKDYTQLNDRYLPLRFLSRAYCRVTHTLAAEKAYLLALLFLTASDYQRLKPFSDLCGVSSRHVLDEFADLQRLADLPLDTLTEQLQTFSAHTLPDPQCNAQLLQQVAQNAYPVPPHLVAPWHFIVQQTLALIGLLSHGRHLRVDARRLRLLRDRLRALRRVHGAQRHRAALHRLRPLAHRPHGGRPGKVSIVSSSLFGTITGSAVANVMVDGPITIPLMKKTGFRPPFAAAVEASASTGGQIMPPIMGAAAFVMAEYLAVSYFQVTVWAWIPALLFYAALFYSPCTSRPSAWGSRACPGRSCRGWAR